MREDRPNGHIDEHKRVRSNANRKLVRERGVCEYCGTNIGPFEAHHIRKKSSRGDDKVSNLACLCGFNPLREGNEEGCHRKVERGAIVFRRNPDFIPPEEIYYPEDLRPENG